LGGTDVAFGELPLDAPLKPNKGKEGGACNRRSCQKEPALWYNHGSYAWYCDECRRDIQFDPVNHRDWELRWKPECGHDQFETRQMIIEREAKETVPLPSTPPPPGLKYDVLLREYRGKKTHSPSLERMLGRNKRKR
jgi:hypothetical protein